MQTFLIVSTVLFWALLLLPFIATLLRPGWRGVDWRVKIALGWDILANAWFDGAEKEYISTRLGRSHYKNHRRVLWLIKLVNALFFVLTGQKNHCLEAYKNPDVYVK